MVPAPPDRRRADRRGTRRRGDIDPLPPRGKRVVTVPLGAGALRPHPHPGMATLARRPVSTGHRTGAFGLRHLVPPRRFLPSHPTVRSRPRDRFRSFPPPRSGRRVAVPRPGFDRSHDLNKSVRPPWSDPASAGDVLGPQRPSPGYTMPPCGAPRCDLGRAGLLHNRYGLEGSAACEGSRPSRLGGLYPDATPDRTGVKAPRVCPFKPTVHWQRTYFPNPQGVHLYFFQTRHGNRDCYQNW